MEWLQNVSEITLRARKVVDKKGKVRKRSSHLKLQYQVSERVAKETKYVIKLLREGEVYGILGGSKKSCYGC